MDNKTHTKICIYGIDKQAKEFVKATCTLEGEKVICTGEEVFVKNLISRGVHHDGLKKNVYPKDGQVFLDALPQHYNSGYLTAVPCD